MIQIPIILFFSLIFLIPIFIRVILIIWSQHLCFPVETAPSHATAIVFGAGLEKNGQPSKVLMERIQTAASLYHSGKVRKVIFSGTNRWIYYNEPMSMELAAIQAGIPEEDILIDPDGFRSFDTCFNAKKRFQIKEAALITQSFHLPRVLLIASNLGIESHGIIAQHEIHRIDDVIWWHIREIPATIRALWDIRKNTG